VEPAGIETGDLYNAMHARDPTPRYPAASNSLILRIVRDLSNCHSYAGAARFLLAGNHR
jgi:hypothetical protein